MSHTHTSLFLLSPFKYPTLLGQINCVKPSLEQSNTGYVYYLVTSSHCFYCTCTLTCSALHWWLPHCGPVQAVLACNCRRTFIYILRSTFPRQQFSENECPRLANLTECHRGWEHAKAFSLHHTGIPALYSHCNGLFACAHSSRADPQNCHTAPCPAAAESKPYNQWLQKAVAGNNFFYFGNYFISAWN